MEDLSSSEQLAFSEDEVSKIINETLGQYLNQQTYDEKKVPQWTTDILETLNQRLVALRKPFKYVATTLIMQRNGAAVHSSTSCYWDSVSDGKCKALHRNYDH
jgi:dynein light chain Tctex-type 1